MRRIASLFFVLSAVLAVAGLVASSPASAAYTGGTSSLDALPPANGGLVWGNGIDCVGPSFCMMVGRSDSTTGLLAATYDGTAWTTRSEPVLANASNQQFGAVSCASTTRCVALGSYTDTLSSNVSAFLADWNSGSWTVFQSVPTNPGDLRNFNGIDCVSATSCVIGGRDRSGAVDTPTIGTWNGTTFTAGTLSSPGTGQISNVSCPTSTFCLATSTGAAIAQAWNGSTWSNISSGFSASATSCATPSFCVGVGAFGAGVKWDGTSWSSLPTATPFSSFNVLSSVSCTGVDDCLAAGFGSNGSGNKTQMQVLSGGAWTAVTSASSTDTMNDLYAVSCGTTNVCVATGRGNSAVSALLVRYLSSPAAAPTTTTTTAAPVSTTAPATTAAPSTTVTTSSAASPAPTTKNAQLARTGTDSALLFALAGGLLAVGVALRLATKFRLRNVG